MSSKLNNVYVITELDTASSADTATIIEEFREVQAGLVEAADLILHLEPAGTEPAGAYHDLALIIQNLKAVNARLESQVANLQVNNIQLTRANEYFRQSFQRIIKKTLGSATSLSDSNEIKAKPGTFKTRIGLTMEEAFGAFSVEKAVTSMIASSAKEFVLGKKSEFSRDEKLVSVYEMFKE